MVASGRFMMYQFYVEINWRHLVWLLPRGSCFSEWLLREVLLYFFQKGQSTYKVQSHTIPNYECD